MKITNTKSDSPIANVSYNPSNKVLRVTFRERGTFRFTGVSAEHGNGFNTPDVSMGGHFNSKIRPNYKGEPVK